MTSESSSSPPPSDFSALLPRMASILRESRRLILVAPPGAGKSTKVAPALIRSGILGAAHPRVILLQPRRIAARAIAARIAEENGWALGEEVGFQVRYERRIGARTRIRVATEGVLNRQLLADPYLDGIGAVILDEFHERSLHTDLASALLKEIQETVREDLRLIIMSATLDIEAVQRFFGDCSVLRAEGRAYPVEVRHQERSESRSPSSWPERMAAAVSAIAGEQPGDILAFLPGAEEIRRCQRALTSLADREGLAVLPLHGRLSAEEQSQALRPQSRRKIVLATNVAETSLTIEGVRIVVDSGLARFASQDPSRGLERLELGRISKASAAQRAGRAGRTGPGLCVRLWTLGEHRGLADFDVPEIHRVDLTSTVLALHAFGHADVREFGWLEAPPESSIAAADALLERLGAWDSATGRVTDLGRRLLRWPVHPRLGRLLASAMDDGYPRHGATIAALLSERDLATFDAQSGRWRGGERGASDITARLERFEAAERARFALRLRDQGIDPGSAYQVAQARDDLLRHVRSRDSESEREEEPPADRIQRWLLSAYPDRVARRRGPGDASGVMVGGRGVRLDSSSIVRDSEFFLALDPFEDRRKSGSLEARVRLASAIEPEWLEGPPFSRWLRREKLVRLDEERGKIVGVARTSYLGLILREDPHVAVNGTEAGQALAESIGDRAEAWVREDDAAAQWLARLDLLRRVFPEAGWPELGVEDFRAIVEEACAGKRSIAEASGVPLAPLLRGRLDFERDRRMRALAPPMISVPSGRELKLEYQTGGPPILAARLQELFSWTETPRIADGRVKVLLHLLAPNYRPVQITEDLANFWRETYFQVRKDLRARYPKHSWPENPLTAAPEAKGAGKPKT